MSIITDVYAREVLDSRGNPTLEVEVYTLDFVFPKSSEDTEYQEINHNVDA